MQSNHDFSFETLPFLMGMMLDGGCFMCMCASPTEYDADLVVLGDHDTDHSLSLKEEIIIRTEPLSPPR